MTAILSKALVWVLGVLLAVSLIFNIIQYVDTVSLKHTITTLTDDNKTLKDNLTKCQQASEDQNKEITDAKTKSVEFQKQIDNVNAMLDKQKEDNKSLIDRLKNQPAPKSCKEITDYLQKDMEIYKW